MLQSSCLWTLKYILLTCLTPVFLFDCTCAINKHGRALIFGLFSAAGYAHSSARVKLATDLSDNFLQRIVPPIARGGVS